MNSSNAGFYVSFELFLLMKLVVVIFTNIFFRYTKSCLGLRACKENSGPLIGYDACRGIDACLLNSGSIGLTSAELKEHGRKLQTTNGTCTGTAVVSSYRCKQWGEHFFMLKLL